MLTEEEEKLNDIYIAARLKANDKKIIREIISLISIHVFHQNDMINRLQSFTKNCDKK
jgi:hypothetical protein